MAARGYSDAERMAHGELVYAGVVRSFLMAGLTLVPFGGRWVPLMNEWFANMSDVYRILGDLPEGADVMQTADGREKTVAASQARLARQIGLDAKDASPWALDLLARYFAEAQLRQITDGAHLVLSHADFGRETPIIGAGVGRFVVKRLGGETGLCLCRFQRSCRSRCRRSATRPAIARLPQPWRCLPHKSSTERAAEGGCLRLVGIKIRNFLHQPAPGLLLLGAGRLVDRDLQIVDLALDFFARQKARDGSRECTIRAPPPWRG